MNKLKIVFYLLTFSVCKNPDVRWRTVETLGLAALLARCDCDGDGNGVIALSLVVEPVHSLQLNSDADLLKCFRSDEQRDSKLNFAFSTHIHKANERAKKILLICLLRISTTNRERQREMVKWEANKCQ